MLQDIFFKCPDLDLGHRFLKMSMLFLERPYKLSTALEILRFRYVEFLVELPAYNNVACNVLESQTVWNWPVL
jgi:hypothetical protein